MFDSKILIDRMKSPFIVEESSKRSQSKSDSEMDPEVFIRRVTPQILEMYDRGIPFTSPEEWDKGFRILGGGQSRRKSPAILERMTWDQFLYNCYEVIKSEGNIL